MKVPVHAFRSRASEILKRAQQEDVSVTHHGKHYAVVISQERYEQLLGRGASGLELLKNLTPVNLEKGELEHPRRREARTNPHN